MKIEDYTYIERMMLLVIAIMLLAIRYWYVTISLIIYVLFAVIGL